MKSAKKLTISIIAMFSLIAVVSAQSFSHVAFFLEDLGDYQQKSNSLAAWNIILTANVNSKNDATLGLSAEKRSWLGTYTFISRCNKSIKSTNIINCTWKDQSKAEYRGTVVLNTTGDDYTGSVSGSMYWTDESKNS